MIPIFIPSPAVSKLGAPQLVGADLLGPRFTASVIADVRPDPGDARDARSCEISERGRTTASPFATSL